jgi:RNA polymerase sigma-70 factor, ECF subfamily
VEPTLLTEHERFEALYREHYWALLRYGLRRTANQDGARDLVAETFILAWQRRASVPADRALPWLYQTAGNLLANQRRREQRAARANERLATQSASARVPDVAEQVEESETAQAVARALGQLKHHDREVLMLHAWEGLRGRDLANALGCTSTAAAVRLHRARHRLSAALAIPGDVDGISAPVSPPTTSHARTGHTGEEQ